jgi:hypothetical protein
VRTATKLSAGRAGQWDGTNFTQVGDDSNGPPGCPPANGVVKLRVPDSFAGQTDVYFKVQVGTAAGIYDGIGIDNFGFTNIPEPSTLLLLAAGLAGLARTARRRCDLRVASGRRI